MKRIQSVHLASCLGLLAVVACGQSGDDPGASTDDVVGTKVLAPGEFGEVHLDGCGSVTALTVVGENAIHAGFGDVLVACSSSNQGGPVANAHPLFRSRFSGKEGTFEPITGRVQGGGGLSQIDVVAAAPSNPNVLYATVPSHPAEEGPRTRMFVLKENASAWQRISLPTQGARSEGLASIDINPNNPAHLVGINSMGVWRIENASPEGVWELVDGAPLTTTGEKIIETKFLRGVEQRNTMYAIYTFGTQDLTYRTVVRRSINNGPWNLVTEAAELRTGYAIDPSNADHLYWNTAQGMFSSRNGGFDALSNNNGLPTEVEWSSPPGAAAEYHLGGAIIDLVSQKPIGGSNPYQLIIWSHEEHYGDYAAWIQGRQKAGFYRYAPATDSWSRIGSAPVDAGGYLIVNSERSSCLLAVRGAGDGGGSAGLVRAVLK